MSAKVPTENPTGLGHSSSFDREFSIPQSMRFPKMAQDRGEPVTQRNQRHAAAPSGVSKKPVAGKDNRP